MLNLIKKMAAASMLAVIAGGSLAQAAGASVDGDFPRSLASYGDAEGSGVITVLMDRIHAEPFNLVATIIFVLAIVHTFLTAKFRHWAHEVEHAHAKKLAKEAAADPTDNDDDGQPDEVSFKGQVLHFLGEVEAVFGMWVVVLIGAITWFKGWQTTENYVGHRVNFTEPMFVVVIMAIAATRPVLRFA